MAEWTPPGAVEVPAEASRGNVPINAAMRQASYNGTILPDLARVGTNVLPGAGSMLGMAVGGMLGGPAGAALGALAGGKAGDWARYALAPSVGLPQQVPSMFGMGDALNAGLAGAGLGLEAGAKPVAEMVGRQAYKPATALQRSFKGLAAEAGGPPTSALVRTGLSRGATVGSVFGRGGSEAANAARQSATDAAVGKIEAAEANGVKITAADLAQASLRRARQANGGAALSQAQRNQQIAEVRQRANEILSEGTVIRRMRNVFTPSEVDLIRKRTQQNMRPTMNQAAQGNFKSPELEGDLMVSADKSIKSVVPGLRGARSNERAAIGTAQMVGNAEMRNRPFVLPGLIGLGAEHAFGPGGGIAAGAGAYAAMSPELQSRLAVALYNAPPWALQQSPLLLGLIARGLYTPHAPDTTK